MQKRQLGLVSVTLKNIPRLVRLGSDEAPFYWQKLKRLNITNNEKLEAVTCPSGALREVNLSNNASLAHFLSVNSRHLSQLNLNGCKSFLDTALLNAVCSCDMMPRLKLQGCNNIKSSMAQYVNNHMPSLFRIFNYKEWE